MPDNIAELVLRGSTTAKNGFSNEKDVVEKFNNWRSDPDAIKWLEIMGYDLESIEKVEAVIVTGSHKADVQVKINIYLKDVISAENISIKLVSNPIGFNQIDKRHVRTYAELWAMPESVKKTLELFTGIIPPTKAHTRDSRRMFLDEMDQRSVNELIGFFEENKILILSDILKGTDALAAAWMLIYQKPTNIWTLLPISVVMNYYGEGPVVITAQGNLKFGRIGIQRKGGDQGRPTAQALQFKMNPAEIVNSALKN